MEYPVYCIPGLGTDRRIFSELEKFLELKFLDWLPPKKAESLAAYATRMADQLPSGQPVTLLGLSFGGIIAMEIAHQLPVSQLILLSSVKNGREIPLMLKLFRFIPLYRLSKGSWRVKSLPYWGPFFGIQKKDEISLLQAMFADTTDEYRMWAINALTRWAGKPPEGVSLRHIHGGSDKVFPLRNIRNAEVLPGGNHFMVYQRAQEVAGIILEKML